MHTKPNPTFKEELTSATSSVFFDDQRDQRQFGKCLSVVLVHWFIGFVGSFLEIENVCVFV